MSYRREKRDYGLTVSGLCTRITALLGDDEPGYENVRWDKGLIEALIGDALWMISVFKPDLFTEEVEIELQPGECLQTLPEDCEDIVEFVCVKDADDMLIPVNMTANYALVKRTRAYPPLRCRKRGSQLQGITQFQVSVSPFSTRSFVVSPLVPEGETYAITALCTNLSSLLDGETDDLPTEFRPWILPIMELVMYLLTSMDRDNPDILALSQLHLGAFQNLTQISFAAIDAARRGEIAFTNPQLANSQ